MNKNLISIIPVQEEAVERADNSEGYEEEEFEDLDDKADTPDNEEYVVIGEFKKKS